MEFERGWKPGLLGWIVAEHGSSYAREWGFGSFFEAKVAEELGAWMKVYDPAADLMLHAHEDGVVLGAICLDGSGGSPGEARLRFFIMSERARGRGIGKRLLCEALQFAGSAGFAKVYLTTFAGLDAARALYEQAGFRLVSEAADRTWGRELVEKRFEWTPPARPSAG